MQEAELVVEGNGNCYVVRMTIRSLDGLNQLAQDFDFQSRTPEETLDIITTPANCSVDAVFAKVEIRNHRVLCDSPNGAPGLIEYNERGEITRAVRYKDGVEVGVRSYSDADIHDFVSLNYHKKNKLNQHVIGPHIKIGL